MTEEKKKSKRKIIVRILIAVAFLAILHFLFRGPYLSNSIKRLIIPVLENVTGKRVIMDKAVINLFPFYIQGKSIKLFDEDGKRLLWITKSRIYLDPVGLLSNDLRIRKLALKEPNLTATEDELYEVIDSVRDYLSEPDSEQFDVTLKKMELTDGKFSYTVPGDMNAFLGSGLNVDMLVKEDVDFDIQLDKGTLGLRGISGLDYELKGRFSIRDDRIRVSEAVLSLSDATVAAAGDISFQNGKIGGGEFTGKAMVHTAIISRLFGIERETDGVLTLSGKVALINDDNSDIPAFALNLEIDGHFYLETLMDILKITENVKGKLALNGRITGTYPEIIGKGSANLSGAEFGTLPIESGLGNIEYNEGRFTLSNFTAHAYDGVLSGSAHIDIPSGDFGVAASVTDVDSVKFLDFIEWDAPFRPGKINGNFDLLNIFDQEHIYVNAFLSYSNTTDSDDEFIDRIKNVEGDIDFENGIVTIDRSRLSSLNTSFSLDGSLDTDNRTIDIEVLMEGSDISDLSMPYYNDLEGPFSFNGTASGTFEDPGISGTLKMGSGRINGFMVSDAIADITHTTGSLTISSLVVNQPESSLELKGAIDFRGSNELFSFDSPYYNAEVLLNNIESEELAGALFKNIQMTGHVNGELSFMGDNADFDGGGGIVITDGNLYGQDFDRISFDIAMDSEKITLKSVDMEKGSSGIAASGRLYFDDRFEISAGSDRISSDDISYLAGLRFDSLFSLKLDGSGTFEEPVIGFSLDMSESSIGGIEIGEGNVNGSVKGQKLLAKGSFLDGRVTADASLLLSDISSWTVDADFRKGRYDFLLAGLIDNPPQDMSAFLEGNIRIRSDKGRISMSSDFNSLNFSLYGYNFMNNGNILFDLDDDNLRIRSFSLIGKDANLNIEGEILLGKNYDLNLDGDIDLLPLQALTDKITSIKGRGNFAIDVNGDWENPEIVGELNVNDTILGLKGFPHKIGPLAGKVFFNRDRVIFDSIKSDFAGGKVVLYGAGYFDGLSFDRLIVSSEMTGIKLSPLKGVNAAFDGKLFFETSSKGSILTGNILLKRAQYKKDVEFESFFTGLKEEVSVSSKKTWLDGILLNIRIVGTEDIIIDNNIAKTPVKVDITLTGNAVRYGLIGQVEAEGGFIYFRGNEFKVLDVSSVDFFEPDRIAPVFHIKAETETGGYDVKLNLDGPLDNFTLSLFSDPHLSEMEILTLLSFGRAGSEGKGVEGGMAASQATSILTGGIQSEVEEGFKHITGFDRIEVEPHTTTSGSVSPKITVGKRFLDEKLSVVYSTSVGSTEENVVRVEYDLGRNISIIGSRDEIGSAGGDIKYKFKFR